MTLRLRILCIAAGALAMLSLASSAWANGDPADAVVELINAARARAGLTALAGDPGLTVHARAQSRAMAAAESLSHSTLVLGSAWAELGENVGSGTCVEAVHEAFMASPMHRDNILHPAFDAIGAAVEERDGILYITVVFGTRASASDPTGRWRAPDPSLARATAPTSARTPAPSPARAPVEVSATPPRRGARFHELERTTTMLRRLDDALPSPARRQVRPASRDAVSPQPIAIAAAASEAIGAPTRRARAGSGDLVAPAVLAVHPRWVVASVEPSRSQPSASARAIGAQSRSPPPRGR